MFFILIQNTDILSAQKLLNANFTTHIFKCFIKQDEIGKELL